MSVTQIQLSSSADNAYRGLGNYRRPLNLTGEYATYFWGTGNPNYPAWDYSNNGRDAALRNVTLDPAGGRFYDNHADLPFAASDLGASYTLWAVVTTAGSLSNPYADIYISSAPSAGGGSVEMGSTTSGGMKYQAILSDNADGILASVNLAFDAHSGSIPELLVMTVQPTLLTLHRRNIHTAVDTSTALSGSQAWSVEPFAVGNNRIESTPAEYCSNFAAGFLANRALSISEITSELYPVLQTHFAGLPNPVAI